MIITRWYTFNPIDIYLILLYFSSNEDSNTGFKLLPSSNPSNANEKPENVQRR